MTATIAMALWGAMSSIASAEFDNVTLQMAHIYNPGEHWGDVADDFKARVEEASGGTVKINISPSGTTGDWPQSIEGLKIGTNDIVLQSVGALDRYGSIAGIEAFPYLLRDVGHFEAFYYGPVGAEVFDAIEEQTGFHLIGASYRGARHLSANREAGTLEQLAGLKLRVPPLKMYRETWENLGASPVPMGFAEVFTSLQHGLIDGQENPLEVIQNVSLYEVQDYVMETGHVMGAMTFIFNGARFDQLSADTQTLLKEAGEAAMKAGTERMIATEADLKANLQEKGMTFIEVDKKAFAAKLDGYAKEFPDLEPWVEKIQAIE
ncbi:TRAP transporter substrate-binding protein [Pseudoprimorskyibacter insulae]|nr:TRAP transporter substrate-binding protein [Pseudoprimorskyibacter insulae]